MIFPKFKNLKIRTKLVISFSVLVILISAVFYYSNTLFLQKEVKQMTMMNLNYAQSSFNNLQKQDTKTLSSALEAIVQDPGIKQAYLEKDRDALYSYTEPLFENLKTKYGITHWYFILPNGQVFLRAHNKNIYGDAVNRFTFLKARETKDIASGIELGKTAYALRVVMPYYNNGELIGYVELGEEIEHFLEILKGKTSNDFSIIADKKYLS